MPGRAVRKATRGRSSKVSSKATYKTYEQCREQRTMVYRKSLGGTKNKRKHGEQQYRAVPSVVQPDCSAQGKIKVYLAHSGEVETIACRSSNKRGKQLNGGRGCRGSTILARLSNRRAGRSCCDGLTMRVSQGHASRGAVTKADINLQTTPNHLSDGRDKYMDPSIDNTLNH